MKKRFNRKVAFSLLKKALRSGLDSPLSRWLSQARNPRIPSFAYAHSSAFSLAEAMVMLVIIAIVMAMAAPLIVHKANSDAKRLIYLGTNSNIVTAMGGNQNFGVGTRNPKAKLHVLSSIKPDSAEDAKRTIFQVEPISGANRVNPDGFQVFADGTTNAACIPDYDRIQVIYHRLEKTDFNDIDLNTPSGLDSTFGKAYVCYPSKTSAHNSNKKGIAYKSNQNGYLISSRSLLIARKNNYDYSKSDPDTQIDNNWESYVFKGSGRYIGYSPSIITQIISLPATSTTARTNINIDPGAAEGYIAYKYIYNGFIMVPMGKGNTGCFYYPMSETTDDITYYEDRNGIFAFVPCVK